MLQAFFISLSAGAFAYWLAWVKLANRIKRLQTNVKVVEQEKSRLLAEIDERCKENLQLVISLTNLESRQVDKGLTTPQDAFRFLQGRFTAMAIVQRALTHRSTVRAVAAASLLRELVLQQFDGIAQPDSYVIEANQLEINVMLAAPLGLIVNEISAQASLICAAAKKSRMKLNVSEAQGFQTMNFSVHFSNAPATREQAGLSLSNDIIKMISDQIGAQLACHRDTTQLHWSLRYANR